MLTLYSSTVAVMVLSFTVLVGLALARVLTGLTIPHMGFVGLVAVMTISAVAVDAKNTRIDQEPDSIP